MPVVLVIVIIITIHKYVGPPYSQTEIFAARVSYAAGDAHRQPLHGFAAAARSLGQTDGRTDGHGIGISLPVYRGPRN